MKNTEIAHLETIGSSAMFAKIGHMKNVQMGNRLPLGTVVIFAAQTDLKFKLNCD